MIVTRKRLICLALAALPLLYPHTATAQGSDLAARPPMGWNSWNHFHDKVDDAAVRAERGIILDEYPYSGYWVNICGKGTTRKIIEMKIVFCTLAWRSWASKTY